MSAGSPLALTVTDDAGRQAVNAGMLRAAGFEVVEARSGGEALQRLAEARPHLVLLDVRLEDIDGFEVCRRIKHDPATAGIPVILMARPRDVEDASRGQQVGADAFLAGPVSPAILEAALARSRRPETVSDLAAARRAEETLRSREAFLGCLIESSPDCIKVLDGEGRLLSMSRGGERLMEIDDIGPYLGRSWPELFPDDAPAARAALEQARRGEIARFEAFLPTRGGTPKWWEVIMAPIRGLAGPDVRLLAVSRDITERKRAERAFDEQAEEFQKTFELSGVGQAQADPTSARLTRVNRKLCAMLGYSAEELLGMTFSDVTHPDERERDRQALRRLLDGEIAEYSVEKRYLHKDGSIRWGHLTATVVRDAGGRPLRTVAVVEDITERRRIAEERAWLYAEAREGQQRLFRLERLAAAIRDPSDLPELLPRIAARLVEVFDGDGAGLLIARSAEDRTTVQDPLRPGREVTLPEHASLGRVVAERRVVCIEDAGGLGALAPLLQPPDLTVLWIAPLSIGDRAIALLYLGFRKFRALSPEERLILRLFAERLGAALHRSRLYAEAQAAQAEARAAEERARFLAEASRHLTGSLNYAETLQTVARLAVPFLADFCIFDVIEPGSAVTLAWQPASPARQALLEEVARYLGSPRFTDHPVSRALASESLLVPEVTEAWMEAAAASPEQLRLMQTLQIRALISVPLRGHTGLVGALICAMAESGRRYTDTDLRLAEELALRAAVAVENARLYEAAVAAGRDAVQANRAKDEFLAVLGHELRNPLAPILNAVHLLDRIGAQTPEAMRLRAIIARQTRRLTSLVDELLDVSRIRLGKVTLKRDRVDFRDAVQKVFEAVEMSEQAGRHDLRLALAAEPLVVQGDGARLEQVVANLLDNALKYSPAGGAVRVSVRREGGEAVLAVRDQGVGIPAESLSTIFDPLVQTETASEPAKRGLGLGLAVVRSLVELHGGTVRAMSAGVGQGSEFIVRLPLLAPPSRAAAGAPAAPEAIPLSVLVVEDDHKARRAVQEALWAAGHVVAAAATALEGLKAAQAIVFRAALIDLDLPIMDGCELAGRLRQAPGGARLRLVALSRQGHADDRRRAAAAGFDELLVMPIDPAAIRRALVLPPDQG